MKEGLLKYVDEDKPETSTIMGCSRTNMVIKEIKRRLEGMVRMDSWDIFYTKQSLTVAEGT